MLVHRFLNKFSIEVTILFGVWICLKSFLKRLKWSQAHVRSRTNVMYTFDRPMLFPTVLSCTSQHQLLGISTVSAVMIFFLFSNIPETSWMIDSNTEIPNWSQVVTRGHFFNGNHSKHQAHPTDFSTRSNLTGQQAQNEKHRLGATDDEMMFKCWRLGSCSFNEG